MLSLAGASEAVRYGPWAEPGWPLPSSPYSWAALRQPLDRLPPGLQCLPGAAAATAAAPAGAERARLPSPQQLFKAEVRQQQQEGEEGGGEAGREQGAAGAGPRAGLAQRPRPAATVRAGAAPPAQPAGNMMRPSRLATNAIGICAGADGGDERCMRMPTPPPAQQQPPEWPDSRGSSRKRRQRRRAGRASPSRSPSGGGAPEACTAAERLPSQGQPPADQVPPMQSPQQSGAAAQLAGSAGGGRRQRLQSKRCLAESADEAEGSAAQGSDAHTQRKRGRTLSITAQRDEAAARAAPLQMQQSGASASEASQAGQAQQAALRPAQQLPYAAAGGAAGPAVGAAGGAAPPASLFAGKVAGCPDCTRDEQPACLAASSCGASAQPPF
jgi:hypothetical protein